MPAASPAIDVANPVLLAWRLERRRRLRQSLALRTTLMMLTLAGVVLFAFGPRLRADSAALLALLQRHLLPVSLGAGLVSAATVLRQRHDCQRQLAGSWLASVPLEPGELLTAVRRRVAARWLPGVAATLALIAALGMAAGVATGTLLGAVALGSGIGALLGWRGGARPPRPRTAAMLPRLRRARTGATGVPDLAALGRWPFAQLRAAVDPHQHARIFAAALLLMPMGVALRIVLPSLLLIATALAATALLRAQRIAIVQAADWLQATPLEAARFARAVCTYAALGQLIASAIGAACLYALGAAIAPTLATTAAWLAGCAVVTAHALHVRAQPRSEWRRRGA